MSNLKIDVLEFLQSLEIRNIADEGDEVRFSCPWPGHKHGDSNASAYMNKGTTAFFCHGCKASGNATYFLSRYKNISILDAAVEIKKLEDGSFREPEESFEKEMDRLLRKDLYAERRNKPIYYELDSLPGGCIEYLHGRGITDSSIDTWGIGYDPITDRIGIPVRNEEAQLIGFKARSYRPEHKPKYLVLGDRGGKEPNYHFPTYDVSKVLFGLDDADYDTDIILVEGELNVIALWQMGIGNAVALNGSNFSETQKNLLLTKANLVTLYLDDDDAGWSAARMVARAIAPMIPVRAAWSEFDAVDLLKWNNYKNVSFKMAKELFDNSENITVNIGD